VEKPDAGVVGVSWVVGQVKLFTGKHDQFNTSKYTIVTHRRRIPGHLLLQWRVYVQVSHPPTPMRKPENSGRNTPAVAAGVLVAEKNMSHPQHLRPEDQSVDSIAVAAAAALDRGLQKSLAL